jgi:spore coat polysaccharide biosynthesis protein SpsF (cytidylyltransferase family)
MIKYRSTGIIIQVRYNSSRLPKKMLLPFYYHETILDVLISKLKQIGLNIILAMPHGNYEYFKHHIDKHGIDYLEGSENDVLSRFNDVMTKYEMEYAVRICADNPFLCPLLLKKMLDELQSNKPDYMCYAYNNTSAIKSHHGFYAEVVSRNAIEKTLSLTNDKLYREHVTNFIYENRDMFNILLLENPISKFKDESSIRFTIDTIDDFDLAKKIYKTLKEEHGTCFEYLNVMNYINEHPDYLLQMDTQIKLKINSK